jgi:hypothetical protein
MPPCARPVSRSARLPLRVPRTARGRRRLAQVRLSLPLLLQRTDRLSHGAGPARRGAADGRLRVPRYVKPQHCGSGSPAVQRYPLSAAHCKSRAADRSARFPDNVLNSALGRRDGNVYEALYAGAKASPLNRVDPFPGYAEHLRPGLDLGFIAKQAKRQGAGAGASKL